ncbi:N-acetylmannosamine kinase [Enterobacter cancerogenus]|uniref:N-acetylmannosamine kinase n=1 Tax=Enterobacter cancerogenus TaxID=69218 RepID=A0AB38P3P7_9ENTR|nr:MULTISPECIES: N-acetylmannosamine kinase [Enterobacter]EKS7429367.1 N-acetylmannosamine kinase [Enterobacter cancerogenus]TKK18779.1 N-acetylmannosamine kinase [Enterobacter cancerogenus]CAD5359131.1 putative N-acetylmannosamine kinase [Enterobacter cancerogenus]HBI6868670.1 N-acetylmannosamine kinase [Enterobacter cancerogenus]
MTTLAIDIGGTKLAAARVEGRSITARRECATPASQTPQALQEALRTLIAPLRAQAVRVAVASTGIIHEGVLTSINPSNLGGLAQFPLVASLSAMTDLPVTAINDAQAAAWAEFCALPDNDDMVFLTVSTGVGGGVVLNGKLQTGRGGLAGHLGHTQADPAGPLCGCGRRGCVEAIASGRGIAAAAHGELAGLDAKAIFARAAQGDPQARQLVAHSARTLAALIADVKAVTDCQTVVVGGSVGLAEGYLPQVAGYLSQQPGVYQVALRAAHYRHDAGLLGAALVAQGGTL